MEDRRGKVKFVSLQAEGVHCSPAEIIIEPSAYMAFAIAADNALWSCRSMSILINYSRL
jgi:hypothetical protein